MRRCLIVLVAVAAMAGPLAAVAHGARVYGGIPSGGWSPPVPLVVVTLSDNGNRVEGLSFYTFLSCDPQGDDSSELWGTAGVSSVGPALGGATSLGYDALYPTVSATVSGTVDAHHRLRMTYRSRGNGTRARVTLTGRVTAARAKGWISVSATIPRSPGHAPRRTCWSGWWLRTRRVPGRLFGGFTAHGGPLVIELNPARTAVTKVRAAAVETCSSGDAWVRLYYGFRKPSPVTSAGTFLRRTQGESSSELFGGTISGSSATGFLQLADNDHNDPCDSGGLVPWMALNG